jgi:hypothetical protein
MWMEHKNLKRKIKMKKVIYTLVTEFYTEKMKPVTDLTFPLMEQFAEKIRADFVVIKDRKFPDFPPVYEKLQIHELGKNNDWSIFIDADALIHPNMFDLTNHVNKDTVIFHGADMASMRWAYDKYFLRDGRNLGACTWNVWCSDWTIDLWKPLDDLTLNDSIKNIYPVTQEMHIKSKESLIDDYTLSRNIAKFGLKHTTFYKICEDLKLPANFFMHEYVLSPDEKLFKIAQTLVSWGVYNSSDPKVSKYLQFIDTVRPNAYINPSQVGI